MHRNITVHRPTRKLPVVPSSTVKYIFKVVRNCSAAIKEHKILLFLILNANLRNIKIWLARKKDGNDYVQTALRTVAFQLAFFELDEYAVSTII